MRKKKGPTRRTPKRTAASRLSNSSTAKGSDTYSNFGPLGPEFQGLKIKRWELAEVNWKKLRRLERKLLGDSPKSYAEAFSKQVSMACYFLTQLLTCSKRGDRNTQKERRAEVIELWDTVIQYCFAQPLGCVAEVFRNSSIEKRCALIIQCYSAAVVKTDPEMELTKRCYGPFSQREFDYVLAHERRIIEGGCGAGYCIDMFLKHGIDALGFDENLYGLSDGSGCTSTKSLIDRGKIILADQGDLPDDIFVDRTLLISWPISDVPYALDILRRYTAVGGKRFMLKFGGFLAFGSSSQLRTISAFFTLLGQCWKQVQGDDVPEYRAKMLENNLFVFERR
jgi:hypothetical protein